MIAQCSPPYGSWFVFQDYRSVKGYLCALINVCTGEVEGDHQAFWL